MASCKRIAMKQNFRCATGRDESATHGLGKSIGAGHYEWVLPWVYDTASHGLYNRYFRGRFQGCDYMDLSPENEYPYRVAVETLPENR